ncbi:unnamed protein product [Ambrosiozyma monospora]|uniref:Unnamed protein product n=1 Tax=Ambrosiozyma monospora TaxID=43982 RepID=A0A9W7DIA1_AMBMO|nr:unnamed protein product [Ambrosiozyma monospora]
MVGSGGATIQSTGVESDTGGVDDVDLDTGVGANTIQNSGNHSDIDVFEMITGVGADTIQSTSVDGVDSITGVGADTIQSTSVDGVDSNTGFGNDTTQSTGVDAVIDGVAGIDSNTGYGADSITDSGADIQSAYSDDSPSTGNESLDVKNKNPIIWIKHLIACSYLEQAKSSRQAVSDQERLMIPEIIKFQQSLFDYLITKESGKSVQIPTFLFCYEFDMIKADFHNFNRLLSKSKTSSETSSDDGKPPTSFQCIYLSHLNRFGVECDNEGKNKLKYFIEKRIRGLSKRLNSVELNSSGNLVFHYEKRDSTAYCLSNLTTQLSDIKQTISKRGRKSESRVIRDHCKHSNMNLLNWVAHKLFTEKDKLNEIKIGRCN